MTKDTHYTERDIIDWRVYERIRSGGLYNMFDKRAIHATGLSSDRYIYILENYSKIQDYMAEVKLVEGIKSSL